MSGATRYEAMFARNARDRCRAFVPFTVLGDPDPATSLEIVRTLVRSGADALELGLAFSDPVADGASIQAADARAREARTTVEQAWSIVRAVRVEFPDLPIGMLVYANLVLHGSPESFHARAASAGVDSVLVADAPLLEFSRFERSAEKHGIAPVLIAPANAPDDRLRAIASRSRAYVYVTSRPGVTGADRELDVSASAVIDRLNALNSAPPLLGFGIGRPEHVRQAVAMGAAGAISGSAIASKIEDNLEDRRKMLDILGGFVREMKAAAIEPDP